MNTTLFYASNLMIVSGYLFLAWGMVSRSVPGVQRLSPRAWIGGWSFLVLCAATHTELAWHAHAGHQIVGDDGSVDWHMNFIHIAQALAIWVLLFAIRPGIVKPRRGPLLRIRQWWWKLGQPPLVLSRKADR